MTKFVGATVYATCQPPTPNASPALNSIADPFDPAYYLHPSTICPIIPGLMMNTETYPLSQEATSVVYAAIRRVSEYLKKLHELQVYF